MPGYIFCSIFFNITGRDDFSQTDKLIWSVVYSFTQHSILSLFDNKCMVSIVFEIGLSVIIAFAASQINQGKWFHKLCVCLFHRTPTHTIWDDIIDLTDDNVLQLELKDGRMVAGILRYVRDDHRNPFFVVHEYQIYRNRDMIEESVAGSLFVVQLSEVKDIKIFYCKNGELQQ